MRCGRPRKEDLYEPTIEEIKIKCEQLQEKWPPKEHRRRSKCYYPKVEVSVVSTIGIKEDEYL